MLHQDVNQDHEYLPIHGSTPFLELARDLVFGPSSHATAATITSLQTISGTGANHLGALFLAQHLQPRQVFISDPTWNNHHLIWTVAGPNVTQKTYPYYSPTTKSIDFDGMISTLESTAQENDVVILHACAHNPTGIDPSQDQWRILAQLFKRKKLFAFFDSAYQGFASGDPDLDAWAVRHFREILFNDNNSTQSGMCVAQSFSKNFGLYGERVGAFHVLTPPSVSSAGISSRLILLQRSEISSPPLYGSRIVHLVLSTPSLRKKWESDLRTMSSRIQSVRRALRLELERLNTPGDWSHIESQIGMFSYTGLSREQVEILREKYHVYLLRNGRASLSGVNEGNVGYVARAICDVVKSVG